jgi:agmatinase
MVDMNFPDYFADAESDFEGAEFVIFGVPYDKTSSFRHGAEKAPREIRRTSWNFETFDLRSGTDLKNIKLHDYGDLDVKNLSSQEMVEKVREFTSKLLAKNKFPIALGGEHSITPGIVGAFPNDIAVLSLDAHMDFRQQYENDVNNHACVMRRVANHINIKNIAVIGVRSAEKEEFEYVQKTGLFYIDAFSIHKNGISNAIKKTKEHLKDKKIYLTLDMDVIDPAYAIGTGTPEPFGLHPLDVLECIEAFSSQLIGFDIVEVCPPYDNGETSILSAKLLRSTIGSVWNRA